jgi:hypothetical protein
MRGRRRRSQRPAVAHFYEEALCPRWALVERLDGPVLNFRRGDAAVSVNLDNWRVHMLELTVDHAARHDERSSLCPAKRRSTAT